MELTELVTREAVFASLKASSKKQVLQEIANRARDAYGLTARRVFEGLIAREKLGSTAMGYGVAIPHARIEGLDRIVGVFARLERPVDFEAADGEAVDLVFALLAPEEAGADHLRALARVSRFLRDAEARAKLRQTDRADALYALLTEPSTSRAA
ncbi:PTS IIA-like nitrogen regulatory protein PtsN [Limibaculum sp. M0105]|uniref:PTS IIA-like nitrogen regulatory protein PtsN n=1 Tax=Thermohalobaculum xanthum TaxID=2753746 RepID=A0A8J7M9D4_9RHOB|nr:PTS IIA-like nitrogen regulatory protein PtsN [Thermohalobaculum xanthum]MBK0400553.1 PTS IIA-like nitrogen regulatory protein PtsN [Thermohalobaculum xanthum]